MAQKQILLPLELLLQLKIAFLERDLALLQAQCLQQQAEAQHFQAVSTLLQQHQIALPVPLASCALDVERGCLAYEWDDAPGRCQGEAPELTLMR